jgi:hypothetical protein
MGTMSATKADAIMPIGMENLPRCHGPGRNLLPTKNTRMKIGIVNALSSKLAPMATRVGNWQYSHKSCNSSNRKKRANGNLSSKYKQKQ